MLSKSFHVILLLSVFSMALKANGQVSELPSAVDQQAQAEFLLEDASCTCTKIFDPVCASDGKTYENPCVLDCTRRQNPFVFGLCKGECPCCKPPYYNNPVMNREEIGFWGRDPSTGTEYQMQPENSRKKDNNPQADCSRKDPVPSCFCTQQYDPVCGSDGVTYGNSCELSCQQIVKTCLRQACQGECPCCACSSGGNTTTH